MNFSTPNPNRVNLTLFEVEKLTPFMEWLLLAPHPTSGLFRRFEDGSYQSLPQSCHGSYKKSLPWDGPWK
jgi:hypothetical protein